MAAEHTSPGEQHTIGRVVEILSTEFPDVTHSSLRFLEREGLIDPDRTAGGHRIFPDDQVERIRRIKIWQRERLSLEEIREKLIALDALPDLDTIAAEVMHHLIAGQRTRANQLILEADEAGMSLDALFDGVIRPVLVETGNRWERGEITVGQEKEISAFLRDIIAHLSSRHRLTGPPGGPVVIAACVEGESHELGLAMISALLRQHGCTVYYLGPNVSPDFLIERIQVRKPDAVLLSAVQEQWLESLNQTIQAIRADTSIARQPRIIVGGAGVPNDWSCDDDNLSKIVSLPRIGEVVAELKEIIGANPGNGQNSSSS